jgi:phosphopantothenate synthetase
MRCSKQPGCGWGRGKDVRAMDGTSAVKPASMATRASGGRPLAFARNVLPVQGNVAALSVLKPPELAHPLPNGDAIAGHVVVRLAK